MSPNPTEYSKSGGDQSTAQTDTAFDPSNTSPEGQEAQAAQESVSGLSFGSLVVVKEGGEEARVGSEM